MSNDASNSGIMQKADQIAFHFYTKLFYTINQARATEEPHSQGKIDKWFNLETPDSDLFTREAREPYRNISLSSPPGPPPLEIQVLLCIPELTSNQVLIHRSDDSSNSSTQQPSSPTTGGSSSPARSQLRIEPTPRSIVLETWTLTFVPHPSSNRLGDQALPTIYKHGIPLFRSLYSLLRILPVWKLYKRLKRRTGGLNRNGHLGITLRVKPSDETHEAGSAVGILGFGTPPSPSHPPLQTQNHVFSPLPHPLGSLTLSATYLSSPNFELDELESHLSNRFISLDLQGFVPTLSKHSVREEREDGSTVSGAGPGVGSAKSPPRAIVGVTGGGRGHGAGFGAGRSAGESTSSISSTGKPAVTSTTSDNATVAERFIIPSPLNIAVTSSSSSSALIPPPRPQFTSLPVPLPFPTAGGATSPSGTSGLALHRTRKGSNSPYSAPAAPRTGPAHPPSPETLSSSISFRRNSHSHSPHRYPYPSSSLSSAPGAVPIRRATATSGVGINPFKGNTLSSVSASVSGSSPSLSIRQGPSSGVAGAGGGGSPLFAGTSGSFSSRIPPSSVGSSTRTGVPLPPPSPFGPAPSSLGDKKWYGMEEREYRGRMRPESDRGDWDKDTEDRERRSSNDGSSTERERFRRVSAGYSMGSERQEDAIGVGVPARTSTRKRYSSSFGNRYAGSGGGVGSGAGEESGRSTPASVSASTGAGGALEEGGDKGKEQSAAGGVTSFLSTTTDDDDISVFVQDIDARKPLSGRVRESSPLSALNRGGERQQILAPGTTVRSPLLSASPPAPVRLSTSPNRGPMLTNQDDVDERLKRMNETFMRSLEVIGKGGGGGGGGLRRRDKEKGKEKEVQVERDTATIRRGGLSLLVSLAEGEVITAANPSATSDSGEAGPTSANPYEGQSGDQQQHPNLIQSSSPTSSSSTGDSSSRPPGGVLHPGETGLGFGLGRGRGSTSASTSSTSVSSEANIGGGGGANSQGSEEVIGRMDLYDEMGRRPRGF